ncbi:hypothetical protein OH77DRAFT_851231 [Trametes cingulata]|nr:hypothetical protein OH77DRAFT_851231 [Trametes cingulata]
MLQRPSFTSKQLRRAGRPSTSHRLASEWILRKLRYLTVSNLALNATCVESRARPNFGVSCSRRGLRRVARRMEAADPAIEDVSSSSTSCAKAPRSPSSELAKAGVVAQWTPHFKCDCRSNQSLDNKDTYSAAALGRDGTIRPQRCTLCSASPARTYLMRSSKLK